MSILTQSYKVEELRSLKDVKDIYNEFTVRDAWLFLSTGAYHGTYLTLDDLELILENQHNQTAPLNGRYWITILIVYPRLTTMRYLDFGEILIDQDDIQWLRDKVRETLKEVEASQYGNT